MHMCKTCNLCEKVNEISFTFDVVFTNKEVLKKHPA